MNKSNASFLDKIGMPRQLGWGYLGILIFMMGNGIELGWLSPYLVDRGMSIEQSAFLFTVYGIIIAISSWFSGVMAESIGPKKTMLAGLVLYVFGTIGFVGFGVKDLNFPVMV
ncbi:MAG TPA: MFS transporter, partial [Bacteroidales bacterium]|nr:MFS transporter [Bacteroidales bacterium]